MMKNKWSIFLAAILIVALNGTLYIIHDQIKENTIDRYHRTDAKRDFAKVHKELKELRCEVCLLNKGKISDECKVQQDDRESFKY